MGGVYRREGVRYSFRSIDSFWIFLWGVTGGDR